MRWAALTLFNLMMLTLVSNLIFILSSEFMLYVVFCEQLVITLIMWSLFFLLIWPALFITLGLQRQLDDASAGISINNQ